MSIQERPKGYDHVKAPATLIHLEIRSPGGKEILEWLMSMPKVKVTIAIPDKPDEEIRKALLELMSLPTHAVKVRSVVEIKGKDS